MTKKTVTVKMSAEDAMVLRKWLGACDSFGYFHKGYLKDEEIDELRKSDLIYRLYLALVPGASRITLNKHP